VSVNEGFDFLGFNVRRYGNKSLIKPEQGGRQTDPGTAPHRAAVPAREQRSGVIKRLNPIIRGWAVSAEIFGSLDQHLWELTFKWARFSHANKPTRWVVARYFDRFNKARQDRWVFGDCASGAYLHKFAWTTSSDTRSSTARRPPDDPALADYWAKRRRKTPLPIDKTSRWLLKAQAGQCPVCRDTLLPDHDRPQTPHEWERWLATTRKTITRSSPGRTACRMSTNPVSYTPTAATAIARHFCRPTIPRGLLEPGARQRARPVLRGAGRSDASGLPVRRRRVS
jgi:RNA-directed DNA polymerase